jgi:hypothetical protein
MVNFIIIMTNYIISIFYPIIFFLIFTLLIKKNYTNFKYFVLGSIVYRFIFDICVLEIKIYNLLFSLIGFYICKLIYKKYFENTYR